MAATGAHDGPNDGVRLDESDESQWRGTYSVNRGYYGREYDYRDEAESRGAHGASWAAELFRVGPEALAIAERIWDAREGITAVVARHAWRARVHVAFHDDGTMTVSEYDRHGWEETVPEH